VRTEEHRSLSIADLVSLAQRALLISAVVSLPVLGVAMLVGLVMALFQGATQVHDAAIGHFPKFFAVAVALSLLGPWMGRHILTFALSAFGVR
jgi:flagellar biosynthetic protein FliQ